MTLATFLQRLEEGKSNYLSYASDHKTGLVSVWRHEGSIVLTWEECPPGEQYDESTYTRDERHAFGTTSELLAFLEAHNLQLASFTPEVTDSLLALPPFSWLGYHAAVALS